MYAVRSSRRVGPTCPSKAPDSGDRREQVDFMFVPTVEANSLRRALNWLSALFASRIRRAVVSFSLSSTIRHE